MQPLIHYLAFPLIGGGAAVTLIVMASSGVAYWPVFPLVTLAAMLCIAGLERVQPYEPQWNLDHAGDTLLDVLHISMNQVLVQSTVAIAFSLRGLLPQHLTLWPSSAPVWAQVLLAGAVIDIGLYAMHRISHQQPFLWRLHMLHHSPERLYWMNGGRRHPLSALILAGPALTLLTLLGATPIAVGTWLAILSVHLCFQHSNLDYSLGPLRHLFCVAENHRWHHKREFEDAQVNFGEVWAIWDHLFRSYHDARTGPRAGDVGLIDTVVPTTYLGQMAWPFKRRTETDDSQ
jgi:sterol desaturase/sphingolipid hydroxylase (fatty acid hydroxylase superfamily)